MLRFKYERQSYRETRVVAKILTKDSIPVVCFPSDCQHSSDYKTAINELRIIDVNELTILESLKNHIDLLGKEDMIVA